MVPRQDMLRPVDAEWTSAKVSLVVGSLKCSIYAENASKFRL